MAAMNLNASSIKTILLIVMVACAMGATKASTDVSGTVHLLKCIVPARSAWKQRFLDKS